MLIGVSHTTSFEIRWRLEFTVIVGLLEDKQSREGRTVMSPFVASIKISGISLILNPRRLIMMFRGSSED